VLLSVVDATRLSMRPCRLRTVYFTRGFTTSHHVHSAKNYFWIQGLISRTATFRQEKLPNFGRSAVARNASSSAVVISMPACTHVLTRCSSLM